MLDGRVKTLHPKIHSGILFDRKNVKHRKEMINKKFSSIDLVIVNFYPFQKVLKSKNPEKILENIDIGGPSMVRSAAKNYKNVTIISDEKDFSDLIIEINKYKGKTSLKFRELMASKAFNLTAFYDGIIASWFNNKLNIQFPEKKIFYGKKIQDLRYGENPHQESAIYFNGNDNKETGLKKISGKELSYNNFNDIFSALEILFSINTKPATVIVKHANPCGVATNPSALTAFQKAFASDPTSAFGGVIACNFKIDTKIATEITKNFAEVILAKKFDKKALSILKKKKNLRIIDISNFNISNLYNVKFFDNSFLIQNKDNIIFNDKRLKCVTKIKPTKKEMLEAKFAFNICKYVKSNAIVITNNFSTIGIGAGQPSRLDSCKIASQKAKKFQPLQLKNSIAASDAFFPFADGVKTLINSGVKIIVQPGGSIEIQK